ncbi:MAG: efflux RND transporter periplasmic adaptor subunit [Thermoguttaceae bacterium]|jgi:multidrug efflux pump subunit AcrA (membrane-fusion protein)|nr:efflux RND transporter periplasmic adaptor subunit [Thermoguttaceae bacterium]
MIRHRHIWFHLLTLAALLLPAAGCGRTEATGHSTGPSKPISVAFAPVHRATIRAELDLVGTLIPVRATTIVSDVDGRIASFPASERTIEYEEAGQMMSQALGLDLGHVVRKGEVLVQIDPVDFELALNAAKAEHELARRNLDHLLSWRRDEEILQLEAMLEEAHAANTRAQADLNRSEQLLAKRAVSQGQFDEARAAAHMAAAGVKRAEAALTLAKAGPTPEEVAVAEGQVAAAAAHVALQQEKLDKTTIRAPYDAVISDRYIDVGDRVTAMPRVEIMQIIDPQVLFAQVSVPERYQGVVKLDDVAVITAEGISTAIPARVDLINAKIDPETRTFRIRITIDNRRQILKAGGFVRVALPVGSAAEVPAVPVEAVVFAEGRPAVFVYNQGHVRRVPVEVGISDGHLYEIASGVEPGQEVAVSRTSLLADGMPVSAVRQAESDPGKLSSPHAPANEETAP